MREYTKKIYFIEETQNIEGTYIEVKTLFVNEDKEQALTTFKQLSKKLIPSFGLVLGEYKIKAGKKLFFPIVKTVGTFTS